MWKTIPENSKIPTKGVVKFGIDPTSDKLHLGHLVPMRMVKKLKQDGMSAHIILGTFTAQMGDPSGRDTMRPILNQETTNSNADSIMRQVKRVIGEDVTFHKNHEWFESISLPEFFSIISKFTVDHLMSRDSFQKRKESGASVGLHEIIVPVLQGLDSVKLNASVEIGGSDQLFNFIISRDMQEKSGQTPEICLMSPIINGLDGRKMSKSFNNCIFLEDHPNDVFGKTMSISDETMFQWLPIFMEEFDESTHPMKLKKSLALQITTEIWGEEEAKKAKEFFESAIQKRELPQDVKEVVISEIVDFISVGGNMSRTEARRLIKANAIKVNGKTISDEFSLKNGDIVRIGKKIFVKAL